MSRAAKPEGGSRAFAEAALGNPLDFLAADHRHQRELLRLLEDVAATELPEPEDIERLRAYFRDELPTHLADEEEDLFPLLRARAAPEDEIGPTLDALLRDHREAEAAVAWALGAVERLLAAPGPLAPEERTRLATFAERERRHLIVENAIVLPLARARLTPADLAGMRRRMLERRGLDRAFGEPDAHRPSEA